MMQDAVVDLPFPSLHHERENNGDFRKDYELRAIDTGDPMECDEIHLIRVGVKHLGGANPSIQRASKRA